MSYPGEPSRRDSAPTVVIVSSVHEYRMGRRGSIPALAEAFHRASFRTVFLSVRFSALSPEGRSTRAAARQGKSR